MEFQKPSESSSHKALIDAVTQAGFAQDDLRRLLWLINAHPELIAVVQIAENLEQIFTCEPFKNLNPAQHAWMESIPAWLEILRWVNTNQNPLSGIPALKDFFRSPKGNDKRHPMSREGMTRHGLYTALWNRHESGGGAIGAAALSQQYLCLQAQFAIAVMSARYLHSTMEDYEAYDKEDEYPGKPMLSYPAALVLREMSLSQYSALLEKLNPITGFAEFHLHTKELISQHAAVPGVSATEATDFIKAMGGYLDRVFNDIYQKSSNLPPTRKGGGSGGGGKIQHGFVNLSDHVYRRRADPSLFGLDDDIGSVEVVFIRVGEDENDRERSGESPDEDARPTLALYDPSEFKGAMARARYAERIKTTAAQRFPWDDNQLTPTELGHLCIRLSSIWENFLKTPHMKQKELELVQAALIVETMLWFGQSLESARGLYSRKTDTAAIAEFALFSTTDSMGSDVAHGWRLPALRPSYKTQLRDELQQFNRPILDSFVVPDVTGLGEKILQFLHKTGRMHERIFSAEPNTAKKMFSMVIGGIADGERITPGRVSRAIGNEVIREGGDQTLAWCVTSELARQNEPRMFYTVYPANKLTDTYVQAVGNLRSGLEITDVSTLPVIENDGYIGARFVVTADAVSKCINNLKKSLTMELSHPDKIQERIDYHNRYTLYTWVMQALCSTLRAINDPTEIISQWKHTDEVAPVSLADKEGIFRDRARLIYLIDRVQSQLDHYLQHRRILIDSIGIQSAVAKLEGDAGLLFCLSPDKKPLQVTKSWVENQLEQLGFPFPGNFHRAFLRTELLEAECPPQAIDAFMGHTSQGESPFDAFSTFDYAEHRKVLAIHLEQILKRLGLVPIWSRLIPH